MGVISLRVLDGFLRRQAERGALIDLEGARMKIQCVTRLAIHSDATLTCGTHYSRKCSACHLSKRNVHSVCTPIQTRTLVNAWRLIDSDCSCKMTAAS